MRSPKRSLISLDAAVMAPRMPLLQYFLYIGGVLLGLLFILDAFLPKLPIPVATHEHVPVIRIASDRKWPERIVYDTSLPTIVPAQAVTIALGLPVPEKDAAASAGIRQSFAQLQLSEAGQPRPVDARNRDAVHPHGRKIAKRRAPPRTFVAVRQPQFSWFGANIW
jgi:hypothetical protein